LPSKWVYILGAITLLVVITAALQFGLDIPEDILDAFLLAALALVGLGGGKVA
jgi:uncharacterized membrane protein